MGNIGDPITPSVPVVGSAGPQFATNINAILTEVVARLSAKVPLASVNFNSSLDLSGSDLLNIGNIVFTNQLISPSGSPFNRFAVFGGNLYYVNSSGPVQITSGASLNAASLAGITGDYGGANPAQLNYVAVDTRYNFFANFGTSTWGYVRALGFDVAGGATSSAFARILWGGSSNITLTLPTVLPAANRIMSVDNIGAITTGTSTALDTNNNITISGTGTYKHGIKTVNKSPLMTDCVVTSGSFGTGFGTQNITGALFSSSTTGYIRFPELPTHARILNVTIGFSSAANRNAATVTIAHSGTGDPSNGSFTDVASSTLTNTGTARKAISSVNLSFSTGQVYYIKVVTGASDAATIPTLIVDYDIP